jgi:hypothetical protein
LEKRTRSEYIPTLSPRRENALYIDDFPNTESARESVSTSTEPQAFGHAVQLATDVARTKPPEVLPGQVVGR